MQSFGWSMIQKFTKQRKSSNSITSKTKVSEYFKYLHEKCIFLHYFCHYNRVKGSLLFVFVAILYSASWYVCNGIPTSFHNPVCSAATEHFITICIFSTCSSYILDARSHMLSLILPFISQLQKYRMISFEHVVTMLLKRLMNHLHISLEGNKLSRLAN